MSYINPVTRMTGGQPASTAARNLNLAQDVKRDFGAAGSTQSTTGTIAASSNSLTLASAIDFQDGQGISVANAGPLPTIAAPTAATATPEGTAGTTTIAYAVAALDGNGGVTASFAFSTTTANATLSATDYVALSVTAVTSAAGYAWYRTSTNGTSPTTTGFIGIAAGTTLNDTGLGIATPPVGVPATAPTAALGDLLVTSVKSGAGSTAIVLAAEATSAVTGSSVHHDDTAAIQAAMDTGLDVVLPSGSTFLTSGSLTVQTGQTIYGYGATLTAGGNYDALVIGGGKLFGLTITYTNSPTSGAAISITGSNAWVEDVYVGPVSYNGIAVSGHAVFINNVHIHATNYGLYFAGSSLRVNGAFITGSNTAVYATGTTMNLTSAELYGVNGLVWDGGSYCWLYDVEANTSGGGIAFSFISGYEVHLDNCWNNGANNSVNIGSGFGYGFTMTGGRMGNTSSDNILIQGGSIISITGAEIWGSTGNADIHITGDVNAININGNNLQYEGTSSEYGIEVDAVVANYLSIVGNTISNVTTPISYKGTGTHVIIANNPGYNPVGSITPPASPLVSATVYQNKTAVPITIYQPAYATTSGTAGSVAVALGSSSTPGALYTQWVNGSTTSALPEVLQLRVPPGWYYSFTTTGATLADAQIQGE